MTLGEIAKLNGMKANEFCEEVLFSMANIAEMKMDQEDTNTAIWTIKSSGKKVTIAIAREDIKENASD